MTKETTSELIDSLFADNKSLVAKQRTPNGDTLFFKKSNAVSIDRPKTEKPTMTKPPKQDNATKAPAYLNLGGGKVLERGTNILDVEVAPHLNRRLLSGIEWFDKCAGGEDKPGLTPGTVTLLTAEPGGGKSTLCMQLADGLSANGVTVLYNGGEEHVSQMRNTAERLGLKTGFVVGADPMVYHLVEHALMLKQKAPKKDVVVFVDSLKTLDDGKYQNGTNSNTPVRVMEELVGLAKEHQVCIVVIGHVNKAGEFEGKQKIAHDCDARCEIRFDRMKNSPTFGKRIFRYRKNRFGPVDPYGTVLNMTANGIVLDGKQEDMTLEDDE